jgi:hypothetical protein
VNADQVSGLFSAGESFIEGTIGAALVVLWVLAFGLHLARPFMVQATRKFTLRLGADLWWIIYVALRDLFLLQVFLGSFIFFYPDVVGNQPLPITGGLAGVCALGALLIKLMSSGDSNLTGMRVQTILIALGATLYLGPYFFGAQMTLLTGHITEQATAILVSANNHDLALPLCYLSGAIAGVMGVIAVAYNFRQSMSRRPTAG